MICLARALVCVAGGCYFRCRSELSKGYDLLGARRICIAGAMVCLAVVVMCVTGAMNCMPGVQFVWQGVGQWFAWLGRDAMQGCHLPIAGAPICLARPSGMGYDFLDRDCDALRRGYELA